MDNKYLEQLKHLVKDSEPGNPHWLGDLVLAGLRFEQCLEDQHRPTRMELTEERCLAGLTYISRYLRRLPMIS